MNKIFAPLIILSFLNLNLFAGVINNIGELDDAAVFRFSIMSDNKGDFPGNSSHMTRCDNWVQGSDFVLGLGDHTKGSSTSYLNWIKTDSFWNTKFYPNIADGENETFGSGQSDWGAGKRLFDSLPGFFGRSNVQNQGNDVDYYAWFEKGGFTVHVISLHFSDSGPGLVEASKAFMQSKLESLGATKTDKDIILVLAHSTGGDFVEQGNFNAYRKELLLTTADFCGSATTHKYGWWNRYINDYGANKTNAVPYNTGAVGNSGGTNGYVEIHILDNPPRMVIQYLTTEVGSRQLHVGQPGDFSQDNNKFGTPIIKEINGPWYEVDWNNIDIVPPANNAEFVSQSVPDLMIPGGIYPVSVTVKNTGAEAWTTGTGHALGSNNPVDNTIWTVENRIDLEHSVAPEQEYTFNFNVTAPASNGSYNFQWRMVDDVMPEQGWFGEATQNVSVTVGSGTGPTQTMTLTATDDAEQKSDGSVSNTSSDLEFMTDGLVQTIAVRFGSVGIPANATVTNAYIQFTGDSSSGAGDGNPMNITIKAHDVDNSPGTNANANDITNRVTTSTSAAWAPPTWSTGATTNERTTNLAYVIQEVVDRGGWNSGNAMTFIFFGTGGLRRAESTNGDGGEAPRLYVEYNVSIPNFVPSWYSSPVSRVVDQGSGAYSDSLAGDVLDENPLTFTEVSFNGGPSISSTDWLTVGSNGSLSGTVPSEVGNYSWTVSIDDGVNAPVPEILNIYVSSLGNDEPLITSVPPTGIIENTPYGYTLKAMDVDGDNLTFSSVNRPSWLSFDTATGYLHGTPASSHVGSHSVTLAVSDGTVSVEQSFNVVVFETPMPANLIANGSFETGGSSPTSWNVGSGNVTGSTDTASDGSSSIKYTGNGLTFVAPTSQTIAVDPNTDYQISFRVHATGLSSGPLVFDTADKPTGAEFQVVTNSSNGGWTQHSSIWNSGSETTLTIRMFAESAFNGTAYFDDVVVTPVVPANIPPVVTSTAVTDAAQGAEYSYTMTAADPNGDAITLSEVALPSWLSFNSSTGVLSGIPGAGTVGDHSVALRASDAIDNTDHNFIITVAPLPNVAPVWTQSNVTLSNVTAGEFYSVDVSSNASDADGDVLSFSILSSTATWLSVSNSGVLSGTPGGSDTGFGAVTIAVSDGINLSANAVYSITVDAAPVGTYRGWVSDNNLTSGEDAPADDPDGDGIENLMEFALGGDPKSMDADLRMPEVVKSGNDLEFNFRREEATLTYRVEKSTDLINWSLHESNPGVAGSDVSVNLSASEMSGGKVFIRLVVVE